MQLRDCFCKVFCRLFFIVIEKPLYEIHIIVRSIRIE
jgi:hypothetical protein